MAVVVSSPFCDCLLYHIVMRGVTPYLKFIHSLLWQHIIGNNCDVVQLITATFTIAVGHFLLVTIR